jgi:hypothetical protein
MRKKVFGVRQEIVAQIADLEKLVNDLRDKVFQKYGEPDPVRGGAAQGNEEEEASEVVHAEPSPDLAESSEVVDGGAE